MKASAIAATIFATIFSSPAVASTLEDVSPHFSSNILIVWQAPTNHLPKRFWTYRKLPRGFSAAAISNGIVMASFQNKGFPRPSTNRMVIWADHMEGEPRPPYFSIFPDWGQMSFSLGDRASNSPQGIARDEAAVKRAWKCASQLDVDVTQLVQTNAATLGTYGVFLPRQIDGIEFFDGSEGFQIQFGSDGKILGFELSWPTLEREQSTPTASAQEIISCIRAYKTPAVPVDGEPDYFARVKNLAQVKSLTITQIKPYYGEGIYGEEPTNNEPPKHVGPFAQLGAIADFGTNTAAVRIYSPILSSEVRRLLANKAK